MSIRKVSVNQIIQSQIPDFVRDEYPLFVQFIKQYYVSLGSQGKPLDIVENLDSYIDLDVIFSAVDSTTLSAKIDRVDSTITVSSTEGFPTSNGLLQIDSEIISYESKDDTTFYNCSRGFSGITGYKENAVQSDLIFESTTGASHTSGAKVSNLSLIFLKQFIFKLKKQFSPGFEGRDFFSGLNANVFVKQSSDFYSAKGTDSAFKILFKAIYGKDVTVIRPSDFTIRPSDSEYKISEKIVVKAIQGDPTKLQYRTLSQVDDADYDTISASVAAVETIVRGNETYYRLSLDFDFNKDIDVRGNLVRRFQQHPKTYITQNVTKGSDTFSVDTTIGFPKSGVLRTRSDNQDVYISYTDKSYTEFYGCTGVPDIDVGEEISLNTYCFGLDDDGSEIRVQVLGVLSDLTVVRPNNLFRKRNRIKLSSLGRVTEDIKTTNWIFNVSTTYDVAEITLQVSPGGQYRVITTSDNNIVVGDSVELIGSDGVTRVGTVNQKAANNILNFVTSSPVNLGAFYKIRKQVAKAKSAIFPESAKYSANVQNIYTDYDESVYVASSSIPNYNIQSLNITNYETIFNVDISNVDEKTTNDPDPDYIAYIDAVQTITVTDHGLLTGEVVVYNPQNTANSLNLAKGIYFVYKIDANKFKLSRSRDNIYQIEKEVEKGSSAITIAKQSAKFLITFTTSATNQELYPLKFADENLEKTQLESQRLVRKLVEPSFDENIVETQPGQIGILQNGVEICNYKSSDAIFYGKLEKIEVSDTGSGYDVIDPPDLIISDPVGSGATATVTVVGSLDRIEIVDIGSDFLSDPVINISGGNGTGASAEPSLQEQIYSEEFDASSSLGALDLTDDEIVFIKNHKFKTGERIVYDNQTETVIGGLVSLSEYFVNVTGSKTITLHNTFSDAVSGTNKIDLTSYGTGVQLITSVTKKKFLTSINVINPGEGYTNNKIVIADSGIKTATNVITCSDHGFTSGELIDYIPVSGSSITGLTTIRSSYYVTALDSDNFKLSEIGGSGIGSDFYYDTKQYVNITGASGGNHTFNYPPIKVSVTGLVGLSTETAQNFNVEVQPKFEGSIKKVNLSANGSDYGSKSILNFQRQPEITLRSGTGAQIAPIVSASGEIITVIIISKGKDYTTTPKITIESATGQGAILTAVIKNNELDSVTVVRGGKGYKQDNTFLTVSETGQGAIFESGIQRWTVNEVERMIDSKRVVADDSFPSVSYSRKYGIEYCHLYGSRALRSIAKGSKIDTNGVKIYRDDIDNDTDPVATNLYHSPILGYAYDGNPIYGPYGFSGLNTPGSVVQMKSGYVLSLSADRPSGFPNGFFVEDYKYVATNDGTNTYLDEYNGRYCVTPEFPNGTYAYFTTINDTIDSSSFFQGAKRPIFPYFIGNKYKSVPIAFNYDVDSEQSSLDITTLNVFRNTQPYGEEDSSSRYDFYINPALVREQVNEIKTIQRSGVESFDFTSRGDGYRVGDSVIYQDESGINKSSAIITSVKGKTISTVTSSVEEIEDVYFFPAVERQNTLVGLTSVPHGFATNDVVEIKDLKNANSFIDNNYSITILGKTLTLRENVDAIANTGIVTFFNIYNTDYQYLLPDDQYTIGAETIRVLNVDKANHRIRVERNIANVSGLVDQHYPYDKLTEKSRKFIISVDNNTQFVPDITNYFDPKDALGLGQTHGPGITSTIYLSNPGVGATFVTIPTRAIYIPNHGLKTGDKLDYNSYGGSSITVGVNSTSSFNLSTLSDIYAVRFTRNTVGISSNLVGLGSDGNYVGIGTNDNNILYLAGIGTGTKHRFLTEFPSTDILQASVIENKITIDTKDDHLLKVGDSIILDVESGITTTSFVSYNDALSRTLFDPITVVASAITVATNSITLTGHSLVTGQKVVYKATTPSTGLEDNKIYFVIVKNSNEIQLSETYYNSTKATPTPVSIGSQQAAELFFVNPPIKAIRNQKVVFDTSSSSLSFGGISCFEFQLYTDPFFRDEYKRSPNSPNSFDVTPTGNVGQSGSKTELLINDDTPNILYYKLTPINNATIPLAKTRIIVDDDNIVNHNSIIIENSNVNGSHNVTGITTRSFTFVVPDKLEVDEYTLPDSSFEYRTPSKTARGPLGTLDISKSNKSFSTLPTVTSIGGTIGSGAIIVPQSTTIGALKEGVSIDIQDIGFDYSSDKTLRPTAFLPTVIRVEALSTFDSIVPKTAGIGYNEKPDLVVLDGFTGKFVDDVELLYDDEGVEIKKNTRGLYDVTPTILAINNTNGAGISTISYNTATRDVTLTLSNSYSNLSDFPFEIGDKILVEKTSVSSDPAEVNSFGNFGFNSEDYGYLLFTVTNRSPNIGGSDPTVTYSLKDLDIGTGPGVYNSAINIGRVVPQKYFPTFTITLKKGVFFTDETINSTTNNNTGVVEYWDPNNEYLSLFTNSKFEKGERIYGESSGSIATIESITQSLAYYDINASAIIADGSVDEVGFLNERTQRIHDNDYYQYFSYSLNSQVQYEDWNPLVSDLNHTSGFRKFSDLVIESQDDEFSGIATSQGAGDIVTINDLSSVIDLEETVDFDLVAEVAFTINSVLVSNELIFNSIILQDFAECISNRVLDIDDISAEFNDSAIQNVVTSFPL